MKSRNAEPVTSDLTRPGKCNRSFQDYLSAAQIAILIIIMGNSKRTVQQTALTAIIQRDGRLQGSITIKQLSGLTGNMLMFPVRIAINRKMKVQRLTLSIKSKISDANPVTNINLLPLPVSETESRSPARRGFQAQLQHLPQSRGVAP
jgi:hypothetical protein